MSTRLAPPVITSVSSEYAMQGLSLLPTENIYEFAAKLLFFAVRWARSIHSFLQVSSKSKSSVELSRLLFSKDKNKTDQVIYKIRINKITNKNLQN